MIQTETKELQANHVKLFTPALKNILPALKDGWSVHKTHQNKKKRQKKTGEKHTNTKQTKVYRLTLRTWKLK